MRRICRNWNVTWGCVSCRYFNGFQESTRIFINDGLTPDEMTNKQLLEEAKTSLRKGSYENTIKCLNLATERKYPPAFSDLARLYMDGKGCTMDKSKAIELLKEGKSLGCTLANTLLAKAYLDGNGVAQDEEKALEYLKFSADNGCKIAHKTLADMYRVGRCVLKDFYWYSVHTASSMEVSDSILFDLNTNFEIQRSKILKKYTSAKGLDIVGQEAVEYITKESENGDDNATLILGKYYTTGFNFESYFQNGIKLLENLVQKNNPQAQYHLGECYFYEHGVFKDYEKAFELVNKSANSGLPKAIYLLGTFYESGIGTEKNVEKAFENYLLSANLGYADGQFKVGSFYLSGKSVKEDSDNAFKYFKLAAENIEDPNTLAMDALVHCYENGVGVCVDKREAQKWRERVEELIPGLE